MITYASKAEHTSACSPTTKKKSFAHFDARNSVENRLFLLRLELLAIPVAIIALSR
jgi:hypothetical protein